MECFQRKRYLQQIREIRCDKRLKSCDKIEFQNYEKWINLYTAKYISLWQNTYMYSIKKDT